VRHRIGKRIGSTEVDERQTGVVSEIAIVEDKPNWAMWSSEFP